MTIELMLKQKMEENGLQPEQTDIVMEKLKKEVRTWKVYGIKM